MLVPIATTSMSLQNLVKDDSLVKTGIDNQLILSINKVLYELNLTDQVLDIPDTSVGQKFTLDSLSLPSQFVNYNISFGYLAQNMLLSADAAIRYLGQLIISQNGSYTALPPVSGFSSDIFQFDGSQFFQRATLSRGTIYLGVNNYFPVPIQNVTLELRNATSGTLVLSHNIPYIGANDSIWHELDISGKTVEGNLTIKLVNLDSPGSNGVPVLIDTADYVKLYMQIGNLRASDAIAVFPEQDVLKVTEEIVQEIGDRKLTYVDARQGQLHVFISSSIQQQLELTYILEGAFDRYGRPLTARTTVPAALPGQQVNIDSLFDVAGYSINLTGKDGTKFNTYTQTIIAHADSTGQLAHITLADSLNIRYTIQNVAPNYIKGYIGKDTLIAIDSADFSFLDIFKSGSLDLEQVNMNFTVENGIGVDGLIKINGLTAISPNNGSRNLTGSVLGQPLLINRATEFPAPPHTGNFLASTNSFAINNSNSNIKDLLGILPNKLKYDVEVKTNLAGNTGQYRDFAYLESGMKISLNADIPLSLIANNLLLKDTFDFDLSKTNTNVAGISDGIINLIAQNKYPIEAALTMVAYDENWNAVDTMLINSIVAGADLNTACKVENPKRSKIPLYVNEDRMKNIKRARHAVITADFSTVSNNSICNGQYLKIYSDYKLDITFTARFNYDLGVNF